ncbi:MAG TPA: hypothetical protein VIT20_10935 [Propionibacteriaceae bacterium]
MLEPTFRHLIDTLRSLAELMQLPLATVEVASAVALAAGLIVVSLLHRHRARTAPSRPTARCYAAKLCPPTSKTSLPATAASASPAPGSPATRRS